MARESIEQALPDSNLNIHSVQIGGRVPRHEERQSARLLRLAYADSYFKKGYSAWPCIGNPFVENVRHWNRQPPLVEIDQIRMTGNSGVIGNECL